MYGEQIRICRKKAGLSREKLSAMANLSVTTIYNIENGLKAPCLENFIRLANLLEVPADVLLQDELKKGCTPEAYNLTERLRSLSLPEKRRILETLDFLIEQAESGRFTPIYAQGRK
ncbi:MAG: helix-turn-helix transcriptional regulator [Eubacteriales bacterium]|nr:helix-turn-helix transcriptional regulator [Eubacteriales bacterium]